MNKKLILKKTENYVRDKLGKEGTGHDWWHTHRVRSTALFIAKREGGDLLTIPVEYPVVVLRG